MMKSMNSSFFMVTVLIALLCLWITPTLQLTIQQLPSPVNIGDSANFTVTGVNVTESISCNWFKGFSVTEGALISIFIRDTNQTKNIESDITIDEQCTLLFNQVSQSDIANYILFVQFPDDIYIVSIVMNGAVQSKMSSIVLLAIAGLISSFKLF